jgi:hypothetical protein
VENFLKIITQPDNIAILIMLIAVIACTVVCFYEILSNDRLIKESKKDEIYKRMTR